ncbi:MAG: hypothetical protein ACR2P4_03005 [Gammaproteobacteria bacterium]
MMLAMRWVLLLFLALVSVMVFDQLMIMALSLCGGVAISWLITEENDRKAEEQKRREANERRKNGEPPESGV